MTPETDKDEIVPLVRKLYPNGTDEELREAQQAFSDYVAMVLRIFDRLEREKEQAHSPEAAEKSTIDTSLTDV